MKLTEEELKRLQKSISDLQQELLHMKQQEQQLQIERLYPANSVSARLFGVLSLPPSFDYEESLTDELIKKYLKTNS